MATKTTKKAIRQKSALRVEKVAKPKRVLSLRERLGVTREVFARLLPISVRSLADIETGKIPTKPVERRLTEIQRVVDALNEVVEEDVIGNWLQTPQQAFDGLKPLEVIERGEVDRIWQMIFFLRSGVPN